MISAKKVMNINVVELIKIYNFYFDYFLIRHSGSNIVYKIYISEQYYYHYVGWINDKIVKLKIIDHETF